VVGILNIIAQIGKLLKIMNFYVMDVLIYGVQIVNQLMIVKKDATIVMNLVVMNVIVLEPRNNNLMLQTKKGSGCILKLQGCCIFTRKGRGPIEVANPRRVSW